MTTPAAPKTAAPARDSLLAGAISAALFAAAVWLPPVGFALCLLSPLPVAVAARRHGATGAWISAGSAALALGAAAGPVGAALYAAQFAAGGCAMGLMERAGRPPGWVVGSFAVLSVLSFWGAASLLGGAQGAGPLEYVSLTIREALAHAEKALYAASQDPEAALALQTWRDETGRILSRLFPGLHAVLAILSGWLNGALLRRVQRPEEGPSWSQWRAPEAWIWALIGSGLLGFLGAGPLGTVALNVFVAVLAVYFLQGLAVTHNLFNARGLPRPLQAVAYALLFVQLPVMLLVAGVGAFDLWLDFRTRWARPPEQGSHT